MARAVVRSRGQITLPREIREALHVEEGDEVTFEVEAGHITVRGLKSIPADQAWFWTKEWQIGEREATEQAAAGEGRDFHDASTYRHSLQSVHDTSLDMEPCLGDREHPTAPPTNP